MEYSIALDIHLLLEIRGDFMNKQWAVIVSVANQALVAKMRHLLVVGRVNVPTEWVGPITSKTAVGWKVKLHFSKGYSPGVSHL